MERNLEKEILYLQEELKVSKSNEAMLRAMLDDAYEKIENLTNGRNEPAHSE
ncbi:hypothetical protein [Staphylococcus muscae]|uniref:Uncharacterized protein n=1 Tax=Staphylococcus muscae TaxID=1294 RepID=A0A240BZ47_9STAP|nr:hypothetical protein [Staphylococcus muscae]GGA93162.1 hypothetical protein GCM10007183_16670 [Staphylococcus muscae]SNW00759.1 Uncharacterised protein [Staphylococcus muscae]